MENHSLGVKKTQSYIFKIFIIISRINSINKDLHGKITPGSWIWETHSNQIAVQFVFVSVLNVRLLKLRVIYKLFQVLLPNWFKKEAHK